jgi:hypothetical protein
MHLLQFFLFALLAAFVAPFSSAAQTGGTPDRVSGTLTDERGLPLSYVSVGIPGTTVGSVADEQGRFTLFFGKETNPADSVRFSLLGYRPLTVTVADLRIRLTDGPVQLAEEARTLGGVVVLGRQLRRGTVGSDNADTRMNTNFAIGEKPRQNLGAEVGRKFNLPRGACRLETYRFYVQTNFDSVRFRVNVYSARSFQPLLTRNVYITVPGKRRAWVEVDLSKFDLVVSEDVVVSVQWVDQVGTGNHLSLPIQMPTTTIHYYKYGSQDRWRKFVGMTTAMNLSFACEEKS